MVERKTALITGAASGIGFETVRRLAANPQYDPIFAVDISPSVYTTFPVVDFPNVVAAQVDLRRDKQIDAMIEKVAESGRIDLVVNAAGVIIAGRNRPYAEYYHDPFIKQQILNLWQTNETTVFHIMEKAEDIMRRNGGGIIVNVASSKDYFPDPYRTLYMEGKQSVEEASLYAAKKLREDNIRVVVLKPGSTRTNIDKGVWIRGSNEKEAKAVQRFNDWWRQTFGNDSRNVAEAIYQIAEGRIKGPKVHVGFDAKLGYFLSRTIPFWRQIFYAGAYSTYQIMIMKDGLKRIGKTDSGIGSIAINLGDDKTSSDWYEEFMANIPKPGTPEVVRINNQDYYRFCLGGGIFSIDQLSGIDITPEDVDNYLLRKSQELSGRTRLLESCKPDPEGDWQYRYLVEQQLDSILMFGRESVVVKEEEVFDHHLVFSPVAN